MIGFLAELQNNPLLATGLGLGGAGILTFWIKDIPKALYRFLKRELTTELVMTNQNTSYYNMLKWVEKNFSGKNFRKLKLTNGRWGYNNEATTSIGYGLHYLRYKKSILLINLVKEAANQSNYDKETLFITKLGRSRKLFDDLVKEIETLEIDKGKTKIYKMEDNWMYIKDQKKRSLESIFIEQAKKDLITNSLNKFIQNEQWYLDNGIPYQLGVLLYGAPGTGKTSLIKAISGYLNYPIYYLSPQKLSKIEFAMSALPDKCVVVIEDIDSNLLTHSRNSGSNSTHEDKLDEEFMRIGLSEVLNSLDGMFSAHGRILIATTNHIENLDPALIRPGRIDIKIEIGYVNNVILKSFINKFFPENHIEFDTLNVRPNVTVAMLQNMLLESKNAEEIVELISE